GLAQQKFSQEGLSSRVRLHHGLVEDLPEEAFDAASLLLVLHFVPDEEKAALLSAIAERLKPGAPFLVATLFGESGSTRYLRLCTARKNWAVSKGMSLNQAAELCDPSRPDIHVVSEERLKTLLRDAGFIDVQRIYQALTVGLWFARLQR